MFRIGKRIFTQDSGWAIDIGRRRKSNEDSTAAVSVEVADGDAAQRIGLYAVADGMGGHNAGEVASQLAIHTALHYMVARLTAAEKIAPELYEQWLNEAFDAANEVVSAAQDETCPDMGTTLVMALVVGDQAYIANVGDSRAYVLSAEGIQQITEDHTVAQEMVQQGVLTAQRASEHPFRHVLTRSIGTAEGVRIDIFQTPLAVDDYLLLCSDGLTNELDDETIDWIIRRTVSPQAACEALIRAANAAGGQDNTAVVLVRMQETRTQSSSWVKEVINGK